MPAMELDEWVEILKDEDRARKKAEQKSKKPRGR